jgi:hypothetical protein
VNTDPRVYAGEQLSLADSHREHRLVTALEQVADLDKKLTEMTQRHKEAEQASREAWARYVLHERLTISEAGLQRMIAEHKALREAYDRGSFFTMPPHVNLTIEHQPHASSYQTVAQWLEDNTLRGFTDITPEDAATMITTGEVWVIQWYPNNPVGFHSVAAATLERALQLANDPERK